MAGLEWDPFTQRVSGLGEEAVTPKQLFEAGRGAPIKGMEPAVALSLSLTAHPDLIARLGSVSAGTAEYIRDPRLRELAHRHLLSTLAAGGTLPAPWQRLAEHLGAGWDAVDTETRLHAQAAARTHLGVPQPADLELFPPGPAAVIGAVALELLTPQVAVDSFPTWLARLGPFAADPPVAGALVHMFERVPQSQGSKSKICQ